MNKNNKVKMNKDSLHQFVTEVFEACGVDADNSHVAAGVLCYADENGFDTHGVTNLERIYVARLLDGRVNPTAKQTVVAEAGATAVIDANHGLGLTAGVKAMDLAIHKAKEAGIGCVVVRNSSHFGSAGYYTGQALQAGMIGMAMTNLGTQTIARPLNGKVNMLGTNPIALSAPASVLPPFVLDMSTTVVATGKIRSAERRGESIPEGWLIDDNSLPVTDPAAFDQGTGHLQMLGGSLATGGAKGYGLALMVDILCGVLSGADVGPDPRLLEQNLKDAGQEDQNIGHFFLAIDVAAFRPQEEFTSHMDQMLQTLLDCPPVTPEKKVIYPGYMEATMRHETDEVTIDQVVYEQLVRLGSQLNVTLPTSKEEAEAK
ncbi:LDH2 family malate/lactate/ureidoglycolate dehydrogenase [Paenibacillus sp. DS2015]|uniref:Ldh family oxidoreductase n=1 Tax=Paenibacillus sp. DS2015 TaxID=3373917 RepID=UPI003D1CA385